MLVLSSRWTKSEEETILNLRSDDRQIAIKNIKSPRSISETLACRPIPQGKLPPKLESYLLDNKIIIERDLNYRPPSNLERQLEYLGAFIDRPENSIEKLRKSKVCIVGIGGIGSVALEILAGCGVENFLLIDNDVVNMSNMNRQFIYTAEQIGVPKVEAARSWINTNRPWIRVETVNASYPSPDINNLLTSDLDFAVGSFDCPALSNTIDFLDSCWEKGIPSALAMTGITKNFISPVFDNHLSEYAPRDAFEFDVNMLNRPPIMASSGASNSLVASILTEQILFHLAGISDEVNYNHSTVIRRDRGYLKTSQHKKLIL